MRQASTHLFMVLNGSRSEGFHFFDSAVRHMELNGGCLYRARDGAVRYPDGSIGLPSTSTRPYLSK